MDPASMAAVVLTTQMVATTASVPQDMLVSIVRRKLTIAPPAHVPMVRPDSGA